MDFSCSFLEFQRILISFSFPKNIVEEFESERGEAVWSFGSA